jgi:RNA polymerase sigma factor (sigma-70 family)
MAIGHMDRVIRHLRRAVAVPDAAALADGTLLGSFIEHRDQAAFEALVCRHGPMVLGVCRRILENHHDAEDAFQATFLVLVHKAHTIRPRTMVGNWLHGVATQTALKARQRMTRHRTREKQVLELPEPGVDTPESWHELQPVLDQELERLSDNYRAAIVLCDLEGKTYKDAARQLGWPEGTFSVRLARARKLLAKRLARKGWALPAASLAAFLSAQAAPASMPALMVSSTVRAAISVAAGQAVASGIVSAQVALLTKGVMKAMLLSKLKALSSLVLVFGVLALGGRIVQQYSVAAQSTERQADNMTKSPASRAAKANARAELPPPTRQAAEDTAKDVVDYNALFDKALRVVARYFTVEYANRFEGRIDTLPAVAGSVGDEPESAAVRRRAEIRFLAEAPGLEVTVKVHREVENKSGWIPIGRDEDLERTILLRITGQAQPREVSRRTADEVLLHGEWAGQINNTLYTMVFGPGDSLELLSENGNNLKGTYSVDWAKTPFHLNGQWDEPRRTPLWKTIVEFPKADQLRIQIGVSSDDKLPRPTTFDGNAVVLTKSKRLPTGSRAANDQAQKDLDIGDAHRRAGRYGAAYYQYELICRRYPETSNAQVAVRTLAELKKLRIRLADGSEGWPETSSWAPQPPPRSASVPSAAAPATLDEVSRLRDQVKSLEQRLAALEAKPSAAATTRVSPARVGYIIVEGSRRVSPDVILKELSLAPGQTFDQQALETARKKLAAHNATIRAKKNSRDAGYLDLVVIVEEK